MDKIIPEPNTGCWLFTGATMGNNSYGAYNNGKKLYAAHRFSFEIHFGKIPKDKIIMHKCDTPTCVNPDHLKLGTQKENFNDAIKKGRLKFKPNKCGHSDIYTRPNTNIKVCRVCIKNYNKKYKEKKRGKISRGD